jgi:hypothetical protein
VLAVLVACAGVVTLLVDAYWYTKLRDGTFVLHIPARGEGGQQAYWTGTALTGLLPIPSLITLAAEITWLVWQHRATQHLWNRGYPGLKIRPGWAVGWWFIPFAWWVMPCVAMVELDRRSTPDGTPRRSSPLLGLWWAGWVASALVPIVGITAAVVGPLDDLARQMNESTTVVDFSAAAHAIAAWLLVAGIIQFVTAGLAVAVVLRIDDAQRAMLASGWAGPVPARPDAPV